MADPDPGFHLNADPDPDSGIWTLKKEIMIKISNFSNFLALFSSSK
jgi:hypothetical protein